MLYDYDIYCRSYIMLYVLAYVLSYVLLYLVRAMILLMFAEYCKFKMVGPSPSIISPAVVRR
jgi:hypothetical protein